MISKVLIPATAVAIASTTMALGCSKKEETTKVEVNLSDATVAEVLGQVAKATKKPIVVDPVAQQIANCARVTVLTGAPTEPDSLMPLIAKALEPSALKVEETGAGWIVRRNPEAPDPPGCSKEERAAAAAELAEPVPAAPAPAGSAIDGDLEREIKGGIRHISGTKIELTEPTVMLLLNNADALTSNLRATPVLRDGGVVGMNVVGIRPNDIPSALGFQNGDTVMFVDRTPINSLGSAGDAREAVRNQRTIVVQLERKGRGMILDYRVVR